MKHTSKFIVIAILINISFLAVNAQETTVAEANEVLTEKVEKKETIKKQASSDDSWTGFYVGGFGGYSNGKASANLSTVSGAYLGNQTVLTGIANDGAKKINSKGFSGGGTFGYNYQKGKFFVGGEADFGVQKVNKSVGETTLFNPDFSANTTKTITHSIESRYLFTARPRIGIIIKKAAFYITGGIVITNIKYKGSYTDNAEFRGGKESAEFSKSKVGGTIGSGLEFKVNKHWSVKGEYLFIQFGRTSTIGSLTVPGFAQGDPIGSQPMTHSTDLKSHNIRFGINYRF